MNLLAGGHGSQIAWRFGTTDALSIIQSMTIMDLKESCIELRFKAINLFEASIALSSLEHKKIPNFYRCESCQLIFESDRIIFTLELELIGHQA
jgi:hypothetical protein